MSRLSKLLIFLLIATASFAQVKVSGGIQVSTVTFGATAAAGGGANDPISTGGPFPSLIPYESLSQWNPPSGSGNDTYLWQTTHIAGAHGIDQAPGMLNAKNNFFYVKYQLLESQLTTDPDVANAANYCTTTLGQSSPEALWLHFSNDTVLSGQSIFSISRSGNMVTVTPNNQYFLDASVPDQVVISGVTDASFNGTFTVASASSDGWSFTYNQTGANATSSGGTVALKIIGCGASSPCPASSRIVNPQFGNPFSRRYIWNHGDTVCAQPYLKNRSLHDVTDTIASTSPANHFSGIFWDEMGQADGCTVGPSGIGCTAMPVVGTGGIVKEYGETEQASVDDHTYDTALNSLLTSITTYLHSQGNYFNFPNIAQCLSASCTAHATHSDGVLTEFWDSDGESWQGNLGVQNAWTFADNILAQNKIFIWVQDNTLPTDGGYNTCGSHYTSVTNRHIMWSISDYWLIKQGNYAWYSQQPQGGASFNQGYYAAQEYDIGSPTGSSGLCSDVAGADQTACLAGNRYLWKTGTDSDAHTYQIYRRNFTKGIVLAAPRTSNGDGFPPNYAATTASFTLPGTYKILQGDGTVGSPITSINMCRFEAVTLVP